MVHIGIEEIFLVKGRTSKMERDNVFQLHNIEFMLIRM